MRFAGGICGIVVGCAACGGRVDGRAGEERFSGDGVDAYVAEADAAADPADDSVFVDVGDDEDAADAAALDAACAAIADAMCSADTAACCTAAGIKWDAGGCREKALASCRSEADSVVEGARTFDATKLAACTNGWEALARRCTPTRADLATTLNDCAQVFPASRARTDCEFVKCDSDADCIPSPSEVGLCGIGMYYDQRKCIWIRRPRIGLYAGEGLPCGPTICPDDGKLCADTRGASVASECMKRVGVGDACLGSLTACCDDGLECVGAVSESAKSGVCAATDAFTTSPRTTPLAIPALCSGFGPYAAWFPVPWSDG